MKNIPVSIEGFDWDNANLLKILRKHDVEYREAEEVFMNEPVILPDPGHSATEERKMALGRTHDDRLLCVIFTIRRNRIRVISARAMSRRERKLYAQTEEA